MDEEPYRLLRGRHTVAAPPLIRAELSELDGGLGAAHFHLIGNGQAVKEWSQARAEESSEPISPICGTHLFPHISECNSAFLFYLSRRSRRPACQRATRPSRTTSTSRPRLCLRLSTPSSRDSLRTIRDMSHVTLERKSNKCQMVQLAEFHSCSYTTICIYRSYIII